MNDGFRHLMGFSFLIFFIIVLFGSLYLMVEGRLPEAIVNLVCIVIGGLLVTLKDIYQFYFRKKGGNK